MNEVNTNSNGSVADTNKKDIISVLIRYVAIAFALFHIYTGIMGPFLSLVQRATHVGGGMILYLLMDIRKNKKNKVKITINLILIAISLICSSYIILNYKQIMMPRFQPSTLEMILALAMVLLIFEIARRTIGWAIPLLSLTSFVYALYGPYFPGIWKHPIIKLEYVLQILFYSDRGIWGLVTGISATIIAVFVIFGSILFATGGGKAFMDLSSYMVGDSYGGAAKISTVASGLFGTISGSAGANVATTGTFTIPLMKRLGYTSEFAAGVECAASSGGQIMPPIMGAGAFIMAELLGVPYFSIVKAAIIPALLFYFGVFFAVDCKSRKENYRGLSRDQIPELKSILHNSLPIFLPIIVLIVFFIYGYTPVTSAMWAITTSVILYIVTDLKDLKNRLNNLINALEQSSKSMLTVIVLIACAQILLSMIALSGAGVKLTNIIIALGGQNMLLAGVFAMLATMILGMGLPTVAAYLLGASVMGPALSRIGVEPIAAHFFIFYYAVFAGLTPPVCGTVFIGSAIANANWLKTAWVAIRLSIGAFIIPFMFLMSPALLLVGTTFDIIRNLMTSIVGIIALSSGGMGYLVGNLSIPIRILICLFGVLMVNPRLVTDIIGVGGFIFIVIYQFIKQKSLNSKLVKEV